MADEARTRRMSVRVREIVADVIERQVKDPRLGMVTVTDTRMTPDLREAVVFYTVWGDDDVRDHTATALESAKGVIRSAVGRGTGLKHTPSITFVHDALPENARHIEDLLERARHADEELHHLAEGAKPAGDADPYRRPAASADEADEADEPDEPDEDLAEADEADEPDELPDDAA